MLCTGRKDRTPPGVLTDIQKFALDRVKVNRIILKEFSRQI